MLSKLLFLLKCKSKFNIILLFIKYKIIKILIRKKIKQEKKYFLELISNLDFSTEFFSSNAYNFSEVLSSKSDNFKYLEVGTFEGGSAIYVATKYPNSKIFCVDNWVRTEDGYKVLDFNEIERNFDKNKSNFRNIIKIKNSSDDFFKNNNHKFDVVYVDGYHKASQVLKDCQNAWKVLNLDGLLICDDYIWDHYEKIEDSPCFAINKFLTNINNFKILKVSNSQIFIKKAF